MTYTAESAGGQALYVSLSAPLAALEARMEDESRRSFKKLANADAFRRLWAEGVFDAPAFPDPITRIDTSELSPEDAARRIARRLTAEVSYSAR